MKSVDIKLVLCFSSSLRGLAKKIRDQIVEASSPNFFFFRVDALTIGLTVVGDFIFILRDGMMTLRL